MRYIDLESLILAFGKSIRITLQNLVGILAVILYVIKRLVTLLEQIPAPFQRVFGITDSNGYRQDMIRVNFGNRLLEVRKNCLGYIPNPFLGASGTYKRMFQYLNG